MSDKKREKEKKPLIGKAKSFVTPDIFLFSDYLLKYSVSHSSLHDKNTRQYHIQQWLKEIAKNFQKGKDEPVYESLAKASIKIINQICSREWPKDNIEQNIRDINQVIEYAYHQLYHYFILKSRLFPLSPAIPYPYPVRHSGVSMRAYLAVKDGDVHSGMMLDACDALQAKAQKILAERRSEIEDGISSSHLSVDARALVRRRLDGFHAEDYWFTVQLNKMLEFFRQNKILFHLRSPQNDDFWLGQLDTYPRLEFVMSSAPCEDCEQFFSELRKILNDKGIYLPIIIYANSPYNTKELDKGSPIALVKYDGSYYVTELSAELPYYNRFKAALINGSLNLKLVSQEEATFLQLDGIANEFMPTIVIAPDDLKTKFILSLYDVLMLEGNLNWNTMCWMFLFMQRLPDGFIAGWTTLNEKKPDKTLQALFKVLVTFETPQEEINQALSKEIKRLLSKELLNSLAGLNCRQKKEKFMLLKEAKRSRMLSWGEDAMYDYLENYFSDPLLSRADERYEELHKEYTELKRRLDLKKASSLRRIYLPAELLSLIERGPLSREFFETLLFDNNLIQNNGYLEVFHRSVLMGNLNLVDAFLAASSIKMVNIADSDGNSPLILAAREGHIAIVARLLAWKAEINHQNRFGDTALHYAAVNMHQEVVNILLKHPKIKVDLINKRGYSPYTYVLGYIKDDTYRKDRRKFVKVAKRFCLHYKKLKQRKTSPIIKVQLLHKLAKSKNPVAFKRIKTLVRRGVNIFARTERGLTASQVAEKEGNIGIFQLLRWQEFRCIEKAISTNNLRELQYLLDSGAGFDLLDANGNSIAEIAVRYNNKAALDLISLFNQFMPDGLIGGRKTGSLLGAPPAGNPPVARTLGKSLASITSAGNVSAHSEAKRTGATSETDERNKTQDQPKTVFPT